jgi:hypothetical protein
MCADNIVRRPLAASLDADGELGPLRWRVPWTRWRWLDHFLTQHLCRRGRATQIEAAALLRRFDGLRLHGIDDLLLAGTPD